MYETCITIRGEHQTIFHIIIYVLKRYKGVEKLSTLILGCCSCIKSVSLINNSRWLKPEAKISGFLKSTKWVGCEYKCLTTSIFWWLDFKGLCSSSRNFKFLCVWPKFQIPLCFDVAGCLGFAFDVFCVTALSFLASFGFELLTLPSVALFFWLKMD